MNMNAVSLVMNSVSTRNRPARTEKRSSNAFCWYQSSYRRLTGRCTSMFETVRILPTKSSLNAGPWVKMPPARKRAPCRPQSFSRSTSSLWLEQPEDDLAAA